VLGGDRGGLADLEGAVAIAVQKNLPESVEAYSNLGSSLIELGDLARGFARQAEGRQAAERFGITGWLRHLRAEQVLEHYWRGRWDSALRHANEFIAESETTHATAWKALAGSYVAGFGWPVATCPPPWRTPTSSLCSPAWPQIPNWSTARSRSAPGWPS
jgi:hypothetical protein